MLIKFENTITLGTIVHLVTLVVMLAHITKKAFIRMDSIDRKQDEILHHIK